MPQNPDKETSRTLGAWVERQWNDSVLPALQEFIRIPNQSPAFDRDWQTHGHMDRAVELVRGWMLSQNVDGLQLEVVRAPGRTPLLFAEIPGSGTQTVLLYGHIDKQPPLDGWHEGLGPWQPIIRDGKLYGRGAADDGYAAFAAITAIRALQVHRLPHARCVLVIEASEESGSPDLPAHIERLRERIATPSLVVGLDSGCGDYERLWLTTSLRGLIGGTLTVETLTEGVHSGAASGIVPSSFRIARQLLDRIEDARTGEIRVEALHVQIPAARAAEARAAAQTLGAEFIAAFPFHQRTQPVTGDAAELLLNRTWRPQLEITGAAGLPPAREAGNVLRPRTALQLSMRLPPTADAAQASAALRQWLEAEPPYHCTVQFRCAQGTSGWDAPPLAPWLREAITAASLAHFGQPPGFAGEGGTIPFMGMLARAFPAAQFVITGVLGPYANAHGPNEFLHLATARRLTASIAHILHAHAVAI